VSTISDVNRNLIIGLYQTVFSNREREREIEDFSRLSSRRFYAAFLAHFPFKILCELRLDQITLSIISCFLFSVPASGWSQEWLSASKTRNWLRTRGLCARLRDVSYGARSGTRDPVSERFQVSGNRITCLSREN